MGQRAGDPAATTEQAEEMEGDGVPWESEPGPGGGGMIRELCRSLGRYRRYLGRLKQNLRETQKFFRDIKCAHHHSRHSAPTGGGGGGAERGPAGDVAETGLHAGEDGGREGERAGEARRRADRSPGPAKQPRGGGKWEMGRAAGPLGLGRPDPRCRGRTSLWLGGGEGAEARARGPGGKGRAEAGVPGAGSRAPDCARAGAGRARCFQREVIDLKGRERCSELGSLAVVRPSHRLGLEEPKEAGEL